MQTDLMMKSYYELPTTIALPFIKIITRLLFLQEEGDLHKFYMPAVHRMPCACTTYLLSGWSHFIYLHDNTIGLGEQWDYLSTFPRSLVLFQILLHNSHLPTNWGGCYTATDGWQERPGGCAAGAALGVLQWEQQTPSILLARSSCFWYEGWWILRRLRLEAIIPLGVM